MTATRTIAIVGGGPSGVLVAAQLARHPGVGDLRVLVVDRRARMGDGTAFGTRRPCHRLNVPAARMSAFADDPGHFVRWATERDARVEPNSFVARLVYGDYLRSVLRDAASLDGGVAIEIVNSEAERVDETRFGAIVSLRGGETIRADHVVLALGNIGPASPCGGRDPLAVSERYVGDPWARGAIESVPRHAPVLLVGSGLTAIDVTLALHARGGSGPVIHAVSRHGLLPLPHCWPPVPAAEIDWGRSLTTGSLRSRMHAVRAAAKAAEQRGEDWRPVVDSVRPMVNDIWLSLPDDERTRFLRHVNRHWEVHRHRLAPQAAREIARLTSCGRFSVTAGRITGSRELDDGVEVHIRERGGRLLEVAVAAVVNCTGSRADVVNAGDALIDSLVARGSARPGPLGLGLDTDDRGALLGARGDVSPALWTIGSLRRGRLWETTALAEIRVQAEALAHTLSV